MTRLDYKQEPYTSQQNIECNETLKPMTTGLNTICIQYTKELQGRNHWVEVSENFRGMTLGVWQSMSVMTPLSFNSNCSNMLMCIITGSDRIFATIELCLNNRYRLIRGHEPQVVLIAIEDSKCKETTCLWLWVYVYSGVYVQSHKLESIWLSIESRQVILLLYDKYGVRGTVVCSK